MDHPSRRGFLGGSALTLAALTGTLDPNRHLRTPRRDLTDEYDLSADLASGLESIPAESAVELAYRLVVAEDVSGIDAAEDLPHEARIAGRELDVEADDLSSVVTAIPHDHRRRITVAVGSMDRYEDGETLGTVDGWRLAGDGATAIASTDGRTAFVAGEDGAERRNDARAVIEAVRGEIDGLVESNDDAAEAFERLDGFSTVLFVPNAADSGFRTAATGSIDAFAGGFEVHPTNLKDRAETEYVLFTDGNDPPTESAIRSLIEDVGSGIVREATIDRDSGGRNVILVEATVEAPPDYDREAAPEFRVRPSLDREDGILSIEHVGGETVDGEDLETLELWIDGELADEQPADRVETFDSGDALTVAVESLSRVTLRWFDEAENRQYVYLNEAVDEEAFEFEYDMDTETLEVTYVGKREADPGKVTVTHRDEEAIRTPSVFQGGTGPISAGETVTIEDVTVDETVIMNLDVPGVPGVPDRPLRRFHVTLPRIHLRRSDGTMVVIYHDQEDRPAEEFRVLVDNEPADVQLAERTETLSGGDTVEIGDQPVGSTVVVEWTKSDEPITVAEQHVVPEAFMDVEYDAETGTARVEHRDGETMNAKNLELRVDEEPAATQPADEHDEFGPGDVVTAEVPPFTTVEMVWIGEKTEHGLGETMTARDAIEATYDPEAADMKLTYVGEQPADPTGLQVSLNDARSPREGDGESGESEANREREEPPSFADEYEQLTAGDSIVLEDVAIGEQVTVSIRHETANAVSVRSIGHFPTQPRHGFVFRNDPNGPTGSPRAERSAGSTEMARESGETDELHAVYVDRVNRSASEFRLLVDGEPAGTQPADEHDLLERQDAVPLGDPETGTTLRAEWTVPDEPIEVGFEVIVPEASFEVDHDADAEELVVRHAGGDPIDAERLSVHVAIRSEGPISWEGEGAVEAGDSMTIDVEEPPREVVVRFDEREVIDHGSTE